MLELQAQWWVVTDLDGTLMDNNYDISPALDTIRWLESLSIPIIPCTSKTAAEVSLFMNKYGLNSPYIVENGGSIHGNYNNSSESWELVLGKKHEELRPLLDELSHKIGYKLRALKDLAKEEIHNLTGLDEEGIKLACDRKWSVPFLNPKSQDMDKINILSKELKITILKGNRMSHLISEDTDKGKAVIALKEFLSQPNARIIGLGDSPNDIPLLKVADIPIVVPNSLGPNESLIKQLQKDHVLIAPEPHGAGWAKAIRSCLGSIQK